MIKRTPEEIVRGIPGRCARVYRSLAQLQAVTPCKDASHRNAWFSTDEIVRWAGRADDGRKVRLLLECCPHVVQRCYRDRCTSIMHYDDPSRYGDPDYVPAIRRCGKPIALYRLAD